jgi:predicted RNA-binding protein
MCQMSAVVEHDGEIELIMENITRLDVLAGGVKISSLFEGETELAEMAVHHIDFLAGKVFLQKSPLTI